MTMAVARTVDTLAASASSSPGLARPALVRRVDIGEPIAAWQGEADTLAGLERALEYLAAFEPERLTLVVVLPPTPAKLTGAARTTLVGRMSRMAERVVLTRLSGEVADLRGAESAACGRLVQVEADPRRAVVGAMLSLGAGDGIAVIAPGGEGRQTATGLMAQGVLWRASLESPEDGLVHDLPPAGE